MTLTAMSMVARLSMYTGAPLCTADALNLARARIHRALKQLETERELQGEKEGRIRKQRHLHSVG